MARARAPIAEVEEVLERGAQHVHYHDVERLVRDGVVSADVVEGGDARLPTELVDEFALPEKHHMFLMLGRFLLKQQ